MMKNKKIVLFIVIILFIIGLLVILLFSDSNNKQIKNIVKNYDSEVIIDDFTFYAGFLSASKEGSVYTFMVRNNSNEKKSIDRINVYFYDENNNKIGSMWYSSSGLRKFSPNSVIPIDLYKEIDLSKTDGIEYKIVY